MTAIVLPPRGGRRYTCGPRLTAFFKADEAETGARYSVSEWCMEPRSEGVGAHSHEANDEIFWVVEGGPEILVGEDWWQVETGGGFERQMPAIADWFERNG